MQDKNFAAYGYVVDNFKHPATGGQQAVDSVLTVSNAAPFVQQGSMGLYDVYGTTSSDYNLNLTVEEGQTPHFVTKFAVSDNNSCQNAASGNEITGVNIDVYRSGIGGIDGLGCDASGEFSASNCYTDQYAYWTPTCYQTPGSCTGSTSVSAIWECTFPLWYTADPTDVGSVSAAEDWRFAARGTDDNAATGSYGTSSAGQSEVIQFLSFRATGSPIAYGSLEPGQDTGTHIATTTVYATGNTGLNEYLSGDAMCVTFPACNNLATSTIYVPYQHYSLTNSTAYAAGTQLSTSTAPAFVDTIITKTTATSSPSNDDTYWAIAVPSTITYAGDYLGRNYIDGVVAPSGEW